MTEKVMKDRTKQFALRILRLIESLPRTVAGKFSAALVRTAGSEGDEEAVLIEQSDEAPREAARRNGQDARSARGNDAPPDARPPHRRKDFGPRKAREPGGKPGPWPKGGKKPDHAHRRDK